MILKQLFSNCNWLSVWKRLVILYPDQKESEEIYRNVFQQLQSLNPSQTDLILVLEEKANELNPTPYIDVSGKRMNETMEYALEFSPWENWLGMELDKITLREFSHYDIIAHSLYEMTYIGYSQDEIKQQLEELNSAVDEIKNMTEEDKTNKFITLDEMMDKLKDKKK